jgi:prophage regulatory protein
MESIVHLSPIRLICIAEVIRITSRKRSTIYNMADPNSSQYDPTFPRKRKLSQRPNGAVAWLLHEVEEWVQSRSIG